MSSNEIDSVLTEDRLFEPSAAFTSNARIKPADMDALYKKAADDYTGFWADLANDLISWKKPFTTVLDESTAPFYKWFTDG